MSEVLIALLIGLVGHALAGEFETGVARLADKLARVAVLLLPATRRARMMSEWRAHLNATPLSHRKLVVGLGFVIGGVRIRIRDTLARHSEAHDNTPLPEPFCEPNDPPPVAVKLTDRQRECLIWVAKGKSDSVIADLLGLRPKTVNAHIEAAKRKYVVSTRSQLLVRVLRDGQLDYDDVIERDVANDP